MNRLLQTLTLIIILLSCNQSNKGQLSANSTVKRTFTSIEVEDLAKILSFFEGQICNGQQQTDTDELLQCYYDFFQRIENASDKGKIEIQIPFKEQKEMYRQLSGAAFEELWGFGKLHRNKTNETLKHISFKYNGKYAAFLKAFGEESSIVFEYSDAFCEAGDLSPSMVAGLIKNYKSYDVSDIRIRLLVAMHYLTLNDQYERKEDYEG